MAEVRAQCRFDVCFINGHDGGTDQLGVACGRLQKDGFGAPSSSQAWGQRRKQGFDPLHSAMPGPVDLGIWKLVFDAAWHASEVLSPDPQSELALRFTREFDI